MTSKSNFLYCVGEVLKRSFLHATQVRSIFCSLIDAPLPCRQSYPCPLKLLPGKGKLPEEHLEVESEPEQWEVESEPEQEYEEEEVQEEVHEEAHGEGDPEEEVHEDAPLEEDEEEEQAEDEVAVMKKQPVNVTPPPPPTPKWAWRPRPHMGRGRSSAPMRPVWRPPIPPPPPPPPLPPPTTPHPDLVAQPRGLLGTLQQHCCCWH